MYLGVAEQGVDALGGPSAPGAGGSALSRAAMVGMPSVPAVRQVKIWETMRARAGSRDVIREGFDVYVGPERAASQLTWYESEVVSGLLQA